MAVFQRKSVYKWIAAVGLDLEETGLQKVLHIILPPLQRDVNNQSTIQGWWGARLNHDFFFVYCV